MASTQTKRVYKLTERELANARSAYLEVTDRLYQLQEWGRLDEDWVMMKAKEIVADFKKETGIDLEEL